MPAHVDDFDLALAHYRLLFPTLASLGTAAADWRTEYDRVAASGLSPTLLTSTSFEGGASGASRNFSQTVLLEALHCRRAELDSDYSATVTAPAPRLGRPMGITVRLGP